MRFWRTTACVAVLVGSCLGIVSGQQGRGGRGGQAETYWVLKTKGGVYVPPNKPLTKLADLKAKHAGQANWTELVVQDLEMEAIYHSAAPGTKMSRQLHPDTGNFLVIVDGEMHVDIEGQAPVVATRGSVVNILKGTYFSYEITGGKPALWVDVNPRNFQTVYPGDGPAPVAPAGAQAVKVSFGHAPPAYAAPNSPHWNLFEAAKAGAPGGAVVLQDHLYAAPLYGFADANDPLNPNRGNGGRGGRGAAAAGPFDPASVFGHLHAGPAEWWIVQVGEITGRFENIGELVATEGDVLYAAPMMWHQMGFRGPGPSCRFAIMAYPFINMNSIVDR